MWPLLALELLVSTSLRLAIGSSWLITIVDNEGGFVYVEVGRCRGVVEVVACVLRALSIIGFIDLLLPVTHCLCRILQGLLYLVLAFGVQI